MDRCPCCNARLREVVICPRCKADLSAIINAEQSAQFWLNKAIHYCLESKTEQSIASLHLSLCLNKTRMANVFRDFLIQQQSKGILGLLAEKQMLAAKRQLYSVRELLPHSKQLRKLGSFTDYLLAQGKHQPEINIDH